MSAWSDRELQELFLNQTPLIDVRAPTEFKDGSIPGSVNLPLMSDEERHLVGICYKEKGQEAAIRLGHELVSEAVKEQRIDQWENYLVHNPRAQVFCFRGGLRSQISCQWITERGIPRHPIPGGYKRLRQFFLSWLNEAPMPKLFRLGGLTGSGKTELLGELKASADLEGLANHRGSAFGSLGEQPAQITFENHLALALVQNQKSIIVEDEAIGLGKIIIPQSFYQNMKVSPLIILEVSLDERIKNIHRDYVLNQTEDFFLKGTQGISRKLGGLRTKEISSLIQEAFGKDKALEHHEGWIRAFLNEYYDPAYERSIKNQKDLIVFRGSAGEIRDWWQQSVNKTLF